MTIKIGINGANGRMGKALTRACMQDQNMQLAAAFEVASSDSIGLDAGEVAGTGRTGVTIHGDLKNHHADFEVLIDFTTPRCTMQALKVCRVHGKSMVIGTTGFTGQQQREIQQASAEISMIVAPNMSIGVNLCLKLIQTAATILSHDYDVEIIEAHHRHKVDAPSGTALRMGEIVAESSGRNLTECAVYSRQGHTGERDREAIGFQSIRAGDIVGNHTVMFSGTGESVEITHKATSRMTYARGAMCAAAWVAPRPRGLYDMRAVLGI